jgi:hypothetical protein
LRKLTYLVLSLAIAACEHSQAPEPTAPSVKQASSSEATACPSQEFTEFLEAFSESKEVQKAFIRYPLVQQQVDAAADPEPKPFVRSLERHQVTFPVLPNKAERKAQSLVLRVDQLASREAKLTLFKSDTDYQVSYFFRRGACWELERIDDASL